MYSCQCPSCTGLAGLGQDGGLLSNAGGGATDIAVLPTASLGQPGGILDPSAPPVTVGDLATFVASGTTSTGSTDPSTLAQLATLVAAGGQTVTSILRQQQIGSLAASTPLAQIAALQSLTGTSMFGSSISSAISQNPMMFLIGGGVLLFLLMRGRP